jgi:thiamine biosynthesis lipoprotein
LSGCSRNDEVYRESRIAMDTLCTITVVSHSKVHAKRAIESGFERIAHLERLLNYFSETSELSLINRASGNYPVKVSIETLEIIERAIEIAEYTRGAFDPTIGPLMKTWGLYGNNDEFSVPKKEQLQNSLQLVDYKKIKVNKADSEVYLEHEGMEIDLGGIAKGFAADKAVDAVKAQGVKSALVAIAGDIKGFGLKPGGRPWKVGIQDPRKEEHETVSSEGDVLASLDLEGKSISTSGDYQRYFIRDGIRYHHIIDPHTGYPATEIVSVSVIAPDGYIADGLSTGIFILGREKGIRLLQTLGFSGIIIDRNLDMFTTSDLKGRITIEKDI